MRAIGGYALMVLAVLLMAYAGLAIVTVLLNLFQAEEFTSYVIGFLVGQTLVAILFVALSRKAFSFGRGLTKSDAGSQVTDQESGGDAS